MSACNIIVDANIVLHYRRIDEIDWPAIAGSSACNLVVVPALMTELERKKATGASPVIKKRASKGIEFFVQMMDKADPITLRSNCTLVFHDKEPTLDFSANRLSPDVDDDRYIASALEIAGETNFPTYIASGDGGLKLKLRSRPLNILILSDALRLPDETDPETRELRQAKQELEKLKTARPKPLIGFVGDGEKLKIEIPDRIVPKLPTVGQIMAKYPIEEPPKPKPHVVDAFAKPTGRIDLSHLSGLSGNFVDRRNEDRRRYYAEYEKYLDEVEPYLERICRIEQVGFFIHNDGLVAAHNIDLRVDAPTGTRWLSRSDYPESPEEPREPNQSTMWDALANPLHMNPIRHHFSGINDGDISISDSGKTLYSSCKALNPKCGLTLDQASLEILDRGLVNRSLQFTATLSFTEGAPIEVSLPFELASSGTIDHSVKDDG